MIRALPIAGQGVAIIAPTLHRRGRSLPCDLRQDADDDLRTVRRAGAHGQGSVGQQRDDGNQLLLAGLAEGGLLAVTEVKWIPPVGRRWHGRGITRTSTRSPQSRSLFDTPAGFYLAGLADHSGRSGFDHRSFGRRQVGEDAAFRGHDPVGGLPGARCMSRRLEVQQIGATRIIGSPSDSVHGQQPGLACLLGYGSAAIEPPNNRIDACVVLGQMLLQPLEPRRVGAQSGRHARQEIKIVITGRLPNDADLVH